MCDPIFDSKPQSREHYLETIQSELTCHTCHSPVLIRIQSLDIRTFQGQQHVVKTEENTA